MATTQAKELRDRLKEQLEVFEKTYGMETRTFTRKYSKGELDGGTDFVEWASTAEMLQNAEKRVAALGRGPGG